MFLFFWYIGAGFCSAYGDADNPVIFHNILARERCPIIAVLPVGIRLNDWVYVNIGHMRYVGFRVYGAGNWQVVIDL
jgi:hypothetical protein